MLCGCYIDGNFLILLKCWIFTPHLVRPNSSNHGNRFLIPIVAMPSSSFLKLFLFVAGDPADAPNAAVACSPTASRSRRSFADGAVGLGIVAALSGSGGGYRGRPAALTRSEPIPIGPTRALEASRSPEPDEGQLSESYTCVISHVGGKSVRKRIYFGDGSEVVTMDVRRGRQVLFETPLPIRPPKPAMPFAAMDSLSHCHLCKKKLEGIDIYMYRGDKAFCSADCRCQQMLFDARRENCGSEVLNSFEYCVSLLCLFSLCSWCCSSLSI